MKKTALFTIAFLLLVYSGFAIIPIDVNPPKHAYTNRDNIFTGDNIFLNVTIVNKSTLIINETLCLIGGGDCISNFSQAGLWEDNGDNSISPRNNANVSLARDLSISGNRVELISDDLGLNLVNRFGATSSNPLAITAFTATNDVGGFTSIAKFGSNVPGDLSVVRNDSAFICSGGRCLIVNNGNGSIAFAHILSGDQNVSNASFSLVLEGDGTLSMQGPLRLNQKQIFLDFDEDHFIRMNVEGVPFNGIAKNATWFGHNLQRAEGDIAFLGTTANKTVFWYQVGKNNSYSGLGNSFGLVPNYMAEDNFTEVDGTINMSKVSSYPFLCDFFNFPCRFSADTMGRARGTLPGGPLFWNMGDIENWGKIVTHEGIESIGPADFSMQGNELNIFNGSLHILTPITCEFGFSEGDEITPLNAIFPGSLSPFVNDPLNTIDWFTSSSSFCDSEQCGQTFGTGGGDIQMSVNFSNLDVNNTNISFVYSLVNLIGLDSLTLEANNNTGSGWVPLFTDSGTDDKVSVTLPLDTRFWNTSLVSLRFNCDATQVTRFCYVDTVKVNGTAMTTTIANETGFNSEICFGSGQQDPLGNCTNGIFYSFCEGKTFIRGILNATVEAAGGISGSGTANTVSKWISANAQGNSNIFDDGSLITHNTDTLFNGEISGAGGLNVTGDENLDGNLTFGDGSTSDTWNISLREPYLLITHNGIDFDIQVKDWEGTSVRDYYHFTCWWSLSQWSTTNPPTIDCSDGGAGNFLYEINTNKFEIFTNSIGNADVFCTRQGGGTGYLHCGRPLKLFPKGATLPTPTPSPSPTPTPQPTPPP